MRLTLLNLANEDLSFCFLGSQSRNFGAHEILSSSNSTFDVPNDSNALSLVPIITTTNSLSFVGSTKLLLNSQELVVRLGLGFGASWRVIPVHAECQWRIFLSKITKAHHKLCIIPRRDLSSFLSDMPDMLSLSSLCLPGTHDTMALYGWPITQCQERITPLGIQLQSGIRVLDIRLAIVDSRLIAYHGIYPQRTSFHEILSIVHDFLTAPSTCRETVVMSIKQEDFAKFSYLKFSNLVHEEIFNGPGGREMWYLENRIPTLGEVRGKVVMFSRFGGNGEGWKGGWEGLGIHPLVWPDSSKSGFSWQCKETLVRTHDWSVSCASFLQIPEKLALATQILVPPANPPMPVLSIAFLSAASIPLSLPPIIAKGFGWPKAGFGVEGVNSRFVRWLLNALAGETQTPVAASHEKHTAEEQRVRGWVLLDFFDEPEAALMPLLVECNYRGRRQGEEGW